LEVRTENTGYRQKIAVTIVAAYPVAIEHYKIAAAGGVGERPQCLVDNVGGLTGQSFER
jgi:hypothetical protein